MQSAIERIMFTYELMATRTVAASREARARLIDYLQPLFDAGETDRDRLAVTGLIFLRKLQPVAIRIRR